MYTRFGMAICRDWKGIAGDDILAADMPVSLYVDDMTPACLARLVFSLDTRRCPEAHPVKSQAIFVCLFH